MSELDFTFLHAADLHLDSPLVGLSAYEGAPAERLRRATRDAFEQLVAAALDRGVRFVVIAGDVFDGDWPDFNSGLWLHSQLRRLTRAEIPVLLVRGNHDAASRVTRNLRWPEGVHAFGDKEASTVRLAKLGARDLDVAVHGQSYADQAEERNLARDYPERIEGAFNLGVLHTSLGGYAEHETYAPCTLDDLRAKGYDYWALGHIHKREVVCEDPWVVFPGNVQGRHARELGAKGASIVKVEQGRVTSVEHVDCDVARWIHARVDLTGAADEPELLQRVTSALRAAGQDTGDRLLAVRVTLQGETVLDRQLRTERERWVAEVRAAGLGVEHELWIEKVRLETVAPRATGAPEGLAALSRQMREAELEGSDLAALAEELQRFQNVLPEGVRASLGAAGSEWLAASLEPARRYLASLLDGAAAPDGDAEATP